MNDTDLQEFHRAIAAHRAYQRRILAMLLAHINGAIA